MEIVLILHSLVRWAIMIFGIWTLVNAITGVLNKRVYNSGDNRNNLLFMISCDIQLLLGLILYFVGPWFSMLKNDASDVMQNDTTRFFTVEHTTMMLLAWVLVHVGRSKVKKAATDESKHKKALIFFGIAILLIVAAIPWPFRAAIARPWFRF